jgi:hypothetical protein
LRNIGVNWRDGRLIRNFNLYMNQRAVVNIQQEFSDESEIGQGVRTGRLLHIATTIQHLCRTMMMEAMEGIEEEIKIGGNLLKNVRFSDDQGMIAGSEIGLQN